MLTIRNILFSLTPSNRFHSFSSFLDVYSLKNWVQEERKTREWNEEKVKSKEKGEMKNNNVRDSR